MLRRALAGLAALLLISLVAMGTAGAQQSPTIPETTTTTVLGEEVTTTTTTTTTTTEAPTTTVEETTTTTVAGDEVTTTTVAAEVRGDVVTRPLPRTGNELGGTALFGGALTILGIALALGARRRRNGFESV